MFQNIRKNPVLYTVLCISLIALALLLTNRHEIEKNNKNVHITADYNEIDLLSKQSEYNFSEWLTNLKKWGVSSVAIREETLKSLREEGKSLEYFIVKDIKERIDWESRYPEEIVKLINNETYPDRYLVVASDDENLSQFIKSGFENRYPKEFFDIYDNGEIQYIVVKADFDQLWLSNEKKIYNANGKAELQVNDIYMNKVETIGLGFDSEKIQQIKDVNLKVLPRPVNYNKYPEKLVEAFVKEMEMYDIEPEALIFGSNELIGQPGHGQELFDYMKNNEISAVLIETPVQREHIEQAGLDELTVALDYDSVRLFSVANYIQKRYKFYNYEGSQEIEHTLYRAITERNIRMIYFKPFKWNDAVYVTDVEEYERMFTSLERRLEKHGISMGDFSVMEKNKPSWILTVLSGFGLVAASLLWLKEFIDLKKKFIYGLLMVGSLGIIAGLFVAPNLMSIILAFYGAILFPSIAITLVVKSLKSAYLEENKEKISVIIMKSVISILIPVGVSIIGGLYVGGILSGSEFLLEMNIFRGVKLSQMLPLIVAISTYTLSFGYMRKKSEIVENVYYYKDLKRILLEDIKVIYVFLGGIVAVVGYLYIARTGHETSIEPTDIEMIIRNFLEIVLLARPRTKEFLIAFPALIMAYSFAKQNIKWLLLPALLAGSIGLTSIANTFSHLRTPLYISLARTFYSLGLGIVIGIIGIVIFRICLIIYRKYFQSYIEKIIS